MQYLGLITVTLLLVLSLTPPASAQDTTGVGVISGTVTKIDGTPAPDIAVCVPALSRCVVTDPGGRFRISDLRAGAYDI